MRTRQEKDQLELALASHSTWGGARRGAGRKPRPRRHVQHRLRPVLSPAHPCHVTLRIVRGLPSLRTPKFVRSFERTLARGCERGSFRVVHYSLQRDHVHLLIEAADATTLGRGMMSLGCRLARAFNRVFERRGRVLEDRYHSRPVTTPREVRNALAYVLLNIRKHLAQAGVEPSQLRPAPDPASSGRWFDGWVSRAAPSVRPPERACVASPRTWLLRIGWKRHGLVDPREFPAKTGTRGRRSR